MIKNLESTVSQSLHGQEITRNLINDRVREFAAVMCPNILEEDILRIIKSIESKNLITMTVGATLKAPNHKPWLSQNAENIDNYYWNRYRQLLIKEGFGNTIVGTIDKVTNKIVDLLQNPKDEGKWQRKGLVVGHVQSGKTANYTGVICKALDAGYRIVIIMAGLLNSLRKQTQSRIDSGVVGLDSALMLHDISVVDKRIGVGLFSHKERSCPVSITTADADFNKVTATQQQLSLNQSKPPLIFVVKKNVSILRNLIDWLKNNNVDLSESPMLLIDDESDHASVNTQKPDLDPTTTNDRIRELLNLFPKNVYLGYTATPFANIFIDPDTPKDMIKDLFPRDFIKTLDAPSNYFGSKDLFIENKYNSIRLIEDYHGFLPLKHKINEFPQSLSKSLKEAVRVFILVCSIRIIRGQEDKHNSMLVNVSRFTDIQSELHILIHNYLTELNNAISNNSNSVLDEALSNSKMKSIYKTFNKEFPEESWSEVQKNLNHAVSRIEVVEVNGSKSAEKEIDYSTRNYPNGRHIITIGGLSLSRGITIEGLSVTYFLRNSIMYDTLMQMGRWFGYRINYEDLCRIYMTEQAQGWYQHIAEATKELRNEFRKMEKSIPPKTPSDFGLCVRNHPDSLIVTARNKMRSANTVIRTIDIRGKLIETNRLFKDNKTVKFNLDLVDSLYLKIKNNGYLKEKSSNNHQLFKKIPADFILDFVASFINHPESSLTDSNSVSQYVNELKVEEKIEEWNVLFVSVDPAHKDLDIQILQKNLQQLTPGIRKTTEPCTEGVMLKRRKLGSASIDSFDLENNQSREVPLIMLHILDCRYEKDILKAPIFPNGVAAYGISFPGTKDGERINKLATYQVNTTWMKEQYGDSVETDSDLGNDI